MKKNWLLTKDESERGKARSANVLGMLPHTTPYSVRSTVRILPITYLYVTKYFPVVYYQSRILPIPYVTKYYPVRIIVLMELGTSCSVPSTKLRGSSCSYLFSTNRQIPLGPSLLECLLQRRRRRETKRRAVHIWQGYNNKETIRRSKNINCVAKLFDTKTEINSWTTRNEKNQHQFLMLPRTLSFSFGSRSSMPP